MICWFRAVESPNAYDWTTMFSGLAFKRYGAMLRSCLEVQLICRV